MLRLFVLLLVLLNAGYFAWSHDMLRAYGWAPARQQEPQRLQQQIRPEAIRILSAEEARRAEQAALAPPPPPPKPPECLQAGLFDEEQTDGLRKALELTLPTGSWTLEPVVQPARWIVYLGKFSSDTTLNRRRAELEKLKIKPRVLDKPELKPGLSLGDYETRAAAQKAQSALLRRGVRTSRVVEEQAEVRQSRLKIPAADDALRSRLDALKPALGDHALESCKP